MTTQVLLTIDTELTRRHHAQDGGWRENFQRSYHAAGAGVPYQLEVLQRHGLKACFFVDPMPACVYGLDPIKQMVEPIIAAGQEVQLHVHSFWRDLARGRGDDACFELTGFAYLDQLDLIESARDLLIAAGAPRPTAFRAGSYAADMNTLAALAALGIRYDSSHNGAEPMSHLPFDRELVDPAEHDGVIEIPISQIRRPDGGLRPLQICALSSQEMRAALWHAAGQRHNVATIVCHSFELASRDGRRVNRLVRSRFDTLCAFLAAHKAILPTADFRTLMLEPNRPAAEPLATGRLRTAHRMAEQAWGQARYENPLASATIVTVPPLVAFEELVALAGL